MEIVSVLTFFYSTHLSPSPFSFLYVGISLLGIGIGLWDYEAKNICEYLGKHVGVLMVGL